MCLGLILSLVPERAGAPAAPGYTASPATSAPARLNIEAPRHLVLRMTGLRVSGRPTALLSITSARPDEYLDVDLLLDTRVLADASGAPAYRIVSSLVGHGDQELLWTRTYEGALSSPRTLQLQLGRALNDALIHTVIGQRTRLMVEKIERMPAGGPG